MGFDDSDLDRFVTLLDERQLNRATVLSLVFQFKKLRAELKELQSAVVGLAEALESIKGHLELTSTDYEKLRVQDFQSFSVHEMDWAFAYCKEVLEEYDAVIKKARGE